MVLETGRYFQNVSCRRHAHRQDLENGVENPDLPAHVDKRGHDPGISYISVGDLAKAFLSKPYVVATDASDSGAGAALCQRIDGKLIVIEYASRAWTPAESRYTATEKECLAMKWAAERWRLYLLAAPVTFRIQPRMDKLAELDTAQMHIPTGATVVDEPNVTFQTDHSALTSLTKKRNISNSRLAHWVTTMSEFEEAEGAIDR